ncbi:hypothetical protein B0H16DRAFT_1480510 [Mycena metata]|uniref:Uncharacterized protein n=1 Tax=Mycena metata TaxID=1033252 RepID=A0AAD7H3R1_9AGAR|nr:hypothetical protein B0H16DRAFT_1480510 [Mycena metata]
MWGGEPSMLRVQVNFRIRTNESNRAQMIWRAVVCVRNCQSSPGTGRGEASSEYPSVEDSQREGHWHITDGLRGVGWRILTGKLQRPGHREFCRTAPVISEVAEALDYFNATFRREPEEAQPSQSRNSERGRETRVTASKASFRPKTCCGRAAGPVAYRIQEYESNLRLC